ncbi:MAG: OmpA family protein [Acidobacteria bacterium]|nr:OmpA family protein [Acidobacteriota bacterium]
MNTSSSRYRPRRASRRHAESPEPHERWLISYADLVTLLFTLFVVLYAAADHERASKVAAAVSDVVSTRQALGRQLSPEVAPNDNGILAARTAMEKAFAANPVLRARARILGGQEGFVVSMAEAGFFAPGEANVRDDARPLIETMADVLKDSDAQLRVEGHTDSTPIATARYPSNWELSSARASFVLAQFIARGVPASRLSLAGYAGERPIADNNTAEGRALNRRVDLVILHSEKSVSEMSSTR